MKPTRLIFFSIVLLFVSTFAFDQGHPDKVTDTTLCQLVQAPEHFKGERVRIRAWLWSDYHKFWITEAGSLEIGKVCAWLPAEFAHPTDLVGSTAYGTFTGRLMAVPTRNKFGALLSCARFIVERQSDIYRQEQQELVKRPFLYDRDSHNVVEPGPCLLL